MLLDEEVEFNTMEQATNPYRDRSVCKRIADILQNGGNSQV